MFNKKKKTSNEVLKEINKIMVSKNFKKLFRLKL